MRKKRKNSNQIIVSYNVIFIISKLNIMYLYDLVSWPLLCTWHLPILNSLLHICKSVWCFSCFTVLDNNMMIPIRVFFTWKWCHNGRHFWSVTRSSTVNLRFSSHYSKFTKWKSHTFRLKWYNQEILRQGLSHYQKIFSAVNWFELGGFVIWFNKKNLQARFRPLQGL